MKVDPDYVPQTIEEFFEPPVGHWRFAHFPSRLLVGRDFEVGGAYEDWGWSVYDRYYDTELKIDRIKVFVTARTFPRLMEKAEQKLREQRG